MSKQQVTCILKLWYSNFTQILKPAKIQKLILFASTKQRYNNCNVASTEPSSTENYNNIGGHVTVCPTRWLLVHQPLKIA